MQGCFKFYTKKSRIRETPNLSTDADSSTDIFVSAGVKKGADMIFLGDSKSQRAFKLLHWFKSYGDFSELVAFPFGVALAVEGLQSTRLPSLVLI